MLDQNAEVAENQKLDKLLTILANQHSDDDDDSDDSEADVDYDSQIQSQDEDDIVDNEIIELPSKQTTHLEHTDLTNITSLGNLMQHLSFEEFDVITECKDIALKELMILNRAKHIHLKELIKKYENFLTDCKSSLKYHDKMEQMFISRSYLKINNMGYPYFRMKDFGPLCNRDFHKKKGNNNMDFTYSTFRMKWSLPMLKKLQTNVIFNYYSNYMAENEDTIKKLIITKGPENEYCTQLSKLAKMREDIADLKTSMKDMNRKMEPPDLWDDRFISWTHIAENSFKDRTLDHSLRAMWNYYVHPKISHAKFTEAENNKIIAFVKENSSPDWSKLAKELNTNRSEHQLCTHYKRVLDEENMDSSREDNDDELLNIRTNIPLSGSWKSAVKISRRCQYIDSMKNCRLGNFTLEEDFKIMTLIKQFGLDFDKISAHMPQRSKMQIKYRYQGSLSKQEKNLGNWELEEDEKIIKHVKLCGEQDWNKLAKNMNRNAAQLRHRYNRLKKMLEENPGRDITTLPRITRSNTYFDLNRRNKMLRAFDKSEHSETDIKQILSMRKRMTNEIDEELVNFFAPTAHLKKTRCKKEIREEHLHDCVSSIKRVLSLFETTLHIPQNLDDIEDLDYVDFEVLDLLKAGNEQNSDIVKLSFQSNDNAFIPPNVSSTQSLRYLLMQSFNCDRNYTMDFGSLMERNDVKLFVKRFRTFFMWPALMSTIEPPYEIRIENANIKGEQRAATSVKRKVGRPPKDKTKYLAMQQARKHNKAGISQASESVQKEPSIPPSQQDALPPREEAPIMFTFEKGELKSVMPATIPPVVAKLSQPGKNTTCTLKVTPSTSKSKIIFKVVDKAVIEKLKQQNRIRTITPVKLPSQRKGTLEVKQIEPSTSSGTSVIKTQSCKTYQRKRKVCDNTEDLDNKKPKLKLHI